MLFAPVNVVPHCPPWSGPEPEWETARLTLNPNYEECALQEKVDRRRKEEPKADYRQRGEHD